MKDKGRKILYPMVMLGLGLAGGALLGKGVIDVSSHYPGMPFGVLMLLSLAWAYFSMFIQIVIHESGHLIFGLLSGYRFVSFRVFGMMWIREKGQLRRRSYSLAGTGGQCLMDAPDTDPLPVILYNMGGVIMNLLASGCALMLCMVFRGPLFRLMAWTFAAVGIIYALINGIPITTAAVQNDGANTLELLKYPETKEAMRKQLRVNALMSDGMRLKDMPADLFETDSSGYRHSLNVSIGVFRAMRLIDEHRFAEADEQISTLMHLPSLPGVYKMQLEMEHVFLQIMNGNRDSALITESVKEALKAMKGSLSAVRTAYAVQRYILKNPEQTYRYRKHYEQMLADWPYKGEAEEERELMDLISGLEQI